MKWRLLKPRAPKLNEQDIRIIKLVSREYSSREIGFELNMSEGQIEDALTAIRAKIGARNEVGIYIYAIKNKLIDINEVR